MLQLFNASSRLNATVQLLTELGKATLGGAMQQQKTQDMFIGRTGNTEIGTDMFEKFKRDALDAGLDVNESLQSSLAFFSSTQGVGQLSKLNDFAQQLNAFDTTGSGIEGAASAVKEAMSGDTTTLAERFNISDFDMEAFKIEDLGKSGNIDGFIKAFDQLLEKQNMGQAAFDQMMKSPTKQLEIFTNNMKSSFADAGVQAMEALAPLITRLNDAFQAGKFQPFIDGLSIGLAVIVGGIVGVADALAWLGGIIQQNWDIIAPILVMMGSALTLWAVTQIPALYRNLCLLAYPIVQAAAAWLLLNWQILLIGAAIGFVLYAMVTWGDTTVEVIGFIGGLFGVLFGFLFNSFAYFANFVLSVAEFIANVFDDPVYAVKKLFYDLSINALQFMANIATGIENLINKIPGLEHIDITSGMDNLLKKLEGARDSLKSEADVVKLMRFEQVGYGDAFSMGQDFGKKGGNAAVSGVQGTFGALKNAFNPQRPTTDDALNPNNLNLNPNNLNGNSTIDRVNEVGKINNTVDISSEDLKTMRELAEMKNIQNFVTLTPTVAMTTGDIHNGQSVDSIIVKIKTMLETEISSSAQGVYA
ncbi:hypothetical protein E4K67_12960 [Desulfosporosinus fructosivorans]|uniref:Phage tail tape measure protein n=1 Tax=Desulfosporosinus fructosivorans TaxID=2018669 RepID=A0A4Z0R687_9FIRM|nr:hypothetical protein E4K67_12960 [Desulfosporosinus fructosivorans]